MSLEAIRQLRRAGQKPSVVFVVIGHTDAPLDPNTSVHVRAADEPALMDWRPLVGVTVALFTLQPLPHLTLQVLDALQAVGVKVFGAADNSGFHPLLVDADESHERLLRRGWELLCQ